jgi:hypothetical protein
MNESKFYDLPTNQGNKTVNIDNIALIEDLKIGTKITMNVRDENGQYLSFIANLPWSRVASDIKIRDENQD